MRLFLGIVVLISFYISFDLHLGHILSPDSLDSFRFLLFTVAVLDSIKLQSKACPDTVLRGCGCLMQTFDQP